MFFPYPSYPLSYFILRDNDVDESLDKSKGYYKQSSVYYIVDELLWKK